MSLSLASAEPMAEVQAQSKAAAQVRPLRIAFAGGGSGGHIYPALAVAQAALLRASRPAEVLFVVTREGLERTVIQAHGHPMAEVPAARLVMRNGFRVLPEMWAGVRAARQALRAFRADVVYGTGGFVSFPTVVAAWLEGIPSLLHEPNTVPGRANAVLAWLAQGVVTHFPQSKDNFRRPWFGGQVRCLELGTPLRYAYDATRRVAGRELTVLVLGGSQGARALNRAVMELYPRLAGRGDLRLVHITGRADFDAVKAAPGADGRNIEVLPYTENMDEILYRTDVAICRAGALTVCEMVEFQIPAIYVPYPNAVGNHQFENARLLQEAGGSRIVEEPQLNAERLMRELEELVRPEVLLAHRKALAGFTRPGAAGRVLEALEGLVQRDVRVK